MRIQEVMGKTGLSRRTIHYYIDQKLIIPPVNEGNGYHDFTEEDVQKLFIIRKLREAGLSPNSINSYMRVLKSFFSWCNEQGLTRLNVPLYKAEETVKETYSDAELTDRKSVV